VLTISPPTGTQGTTYTYDTRGHVASASSGISLWWPTTTPVETSPARPCG
jgi:hypothetical protein